MCYLSEICIGLRDETRLVKNQTSLSLTRSRIIILFDNYFMSTHFSIRHRSFIYQWLFAFLTLPITVRLCKCYFLTIGCTTVHRKRCISLGLFVTSEHNLHNPQHNLHVHITSEHNIFNF